MMYPILKILISHDATSGFPPVGIYWILTGNIKQQNVGQNTATVSMSIHELVKKLRTKFCHGQKEHKFLCIVGKRSNVSLHKQCLLNEQVSRAVIYYCFHIFID